MVCGVAAGRPVNIKHRVKGTNVAVNRGIKTGLDHGCYCRKADTPVKKCGDSNLVCRVQYRWRHPAGDQRSTGQTKARKALQIDR